LDVITSIGGIATFNSSIPRQAYLYQKFSVISNGNGIGIAAFNMFLTLLTAGRIWWISRTDLRGAQSQETLSVITSAIIESGAMFSITTLVAMIVPLVVDPDAHGLVPIDLATFAVLLSGLAPTLIIVRVAYRKKSKVEAQYEQKEVLRTMAFAERPVGGQSTQQQSVDLRSRICPGYEAAGSSGDESPTAGSSEKIA
ncbi:hypothetical protein PQX77_014955, partial [Marasmius sp. AFHP31]